VGNDQGFNPGSVKPALLKTIRPQGYRYLATYWTLSKEVERRLEARFGIGVDDHSRRVY